MPLFFFISGYIAYKAGQIWNKSLYITNIKKKIRIQVIPTLFFGLIFTYIHHSNALKFLSNYFKFGYWFTLALLGIFIIYYTIRLFINAKKTRAQWGGVDIYYRLSLLSY